MALGTAQISTLRTFVQASTNPAIIDARTRGATADLRDLLNAAVTPAVPAWGVVSRDTMTEATVDNIAEYDGLTAGKRDAYRMILELPAIDGGKAKIRNGINATIAGAQAADFRTLRRGILSALLVNASVAQNAIGGSTVTVDTIAGLKRDFDGQVTQEDCQKILA